jgi:hypothetical protein
MLRPTSIDVLRSISWTLDSVIAPALTGVAERSAAATVGHLLRHVSLRIEHEGRLLHLEIEKVRPLLAQVDAYLSTLPPDDTEATRLRVLIKSTRARPQSPNGYRSVENLADEVWALRQSVSDALAFIQMRESDGADSAAAVHAALTTYIAWQIQQEAQLIDPAFEGFGPRR